MEAEGLGVLRRQAPQVVTDGLADGPPLRQQQASSSFGYLENIANTSIMEIDTVDRLGKFLYQADLHEVPPLVQASTLDAPLKRRLRQAKLRQAKLHGDVVRG